MCTNDMCIVKIIFYSKLLMDFMDNLWAWCLLQAETSQLAAYNYWMCDGIALCCWVIGHYNLCLLLISWSLFCFSTLFSYLGTSLKSNQSWILHECTSFSLVCSISLYAYNWVLLSNMHLPDYVALNSLWVLLTFSSNVLGWNSSVSSFTSNTKRPNFCIWMIENLEKSSIFSHKCLLEKLVEFFIWDSSNRMEIWRDLNVKIMNLNVGHCECPPLPY